MCVALNLSKNLKFLIMDMDENYRFSGLTCTTYVNKMSNTTTCVT